MPRISLSKSRRPQLYTLWFSEVKMVLCCGVLCLSRQKDNVLFARCEARPPLDTVT